MTRPDSVPLKALQKQLRSLVDDLRAQADARTRDTEAGLSLVMPASTVGTTAAIWAACEPVATGVVVATRSLTNANP